MVYFTYNPVSSQFDELNNAPGSAVSGPGVSVVGDIATWNDTTGTTLADSGKSFSTDGTFAANSDALIPTQKATKTYVDAAVAGVTFELPAYAATTGALTATYANGASGVGATLTNSGALAAFSTDGTSPAINSRILVKDQASTLQNGMYALTTVGSGAVAWVLTRTTDFDTPSEISPGSTFIVLNGTTLAGSAWVEVNSVTTVGTDPIQFTEYIYPPATFLQRANNLSDVASASTSRSNLGLTAVAIQSVTNHNVLLGAAANAITSLAPSATTGIALVSQGAAADPAFSTVVVAGGGTGATDAAGARTNLGLGTIATQNANNVTISGGTINGTQVGNSSASSGSFTTLEASGILTTSSGQVVVTTVPGAYPYNVLSTDYIVLVDTSSARTIRLPNAPTTNTVYVIKDNVGSAAANNITLTTVSGAVTIDGATSQTLAVNWISYTVVFNGTSYRII